MEECPYLAGQILPVIVFLVHDIPSDVSHTSLQNISAEHPPAIFLSYPPRISIFPPVETRESPILFDHGAFVAFVQVTPSAECQTSFMYEEPLVPPMSQSSFLKKSD